MKRLAHAAVVVFAAIAAAGCGGGGTRATPAGTLDLSWSFVRTRNDATGTQAPPYGCTAARIDTVVVSAGAGSVALPCADASGDGGAVELPPGTYNVVVTGYRGGTGGVALYTAQFSGVAIAANQVTSLAAPLPGRFGQLQVNANFQNIAGTVAYSTCEDARVTAYSFILVDRAGTTVYQSGPIACLDTPSTRPGVFFGADFPVDLDEYTIRIIASGPSYEFDSAVYPSCASPVFQHYGDDVDAYAWNVPVYDVTSEATLCN